MTRESALLGLLADQYTEIARLQAENSELRAIIADLEQLATPGNDTEQQ